MTSLRLIVVSVLAACGLVVITPSTSYACSCAVTTTEEQVKGADAVFVGTLVGREPPPRRQVMSSSDPNTYTFHVQQSLEGQTGPTTVVESAMSGASCGWEGMRIGEQYVVFVTGGHPTWYGSLCGGTRVANDVAIAEVAEITGAGPVRQPPDLSALLASFRVVLHALY